MGNGIDDSPSSQRVRQSPKRNEPARSDGGGGWLQVGERRIIEVCILPYSIYRVCNNKKSGWRDRAVKVHSIVSTVATSPIVRSHSRAAYHDLLSMILQILLPGVALYKVEGRISKSDNRLQSPRSERAAIAPPTENIEYRREHHSQAKY